MNINGRTAVCGLIGNPVEHSISPAIHNNLAEMMNIDLIYSTFKVENDNVDQAVKGAYALNIRGLNVTVPHKSAVIPSLVEVDDLAYKIGAVNTLVRTDKGYKGYNTDILGLKRELEEENVQIENEDVIILGAGGASRAITYLCASLGASHIYLLNRTVKKAVIIADSVNSSSGSNVVIPMALSEYSKLKGRQYIVIQTTSAGLYPNCDSAPIEDMEFYEMVAQGVDIIYNPAETKFMRLVKATGGQAYNGLKMLLYQGVAAFELWNNVKVPKEYTDRLINILEKEI